VPITNETDILRNLQVQNTWWTTGKVEDGLAPEFKRSVYKRVCEVFFNEIRRFPVLSGPRRVGKSTMMFQAIDKLLNDGVRPERILFYTLDEFPNDGIAIKEVVEIYSKYVYDGDDFYLFVDEAQKDKAWKNYIKKLYDLKRNVHVMVTGSASVEIEKESDDSGSGRFFTLKIPTMSFYEFCAMNGKEVDIPPIDVFKMHKLTVPEQTGVYLKLEKLYMEMIRYMKIGGFPEFARSDNYAYISRLLRDQVVAKAIRQDIPRSFDIRDVDALSNLYAYFCFGTSEAISVDTISKNLAIDRATCGRYIEALEKANLIYVSEQLNIGGKKPLKPRKKIHISDYGIKCAVTRTVDVESNPAELGAAIETIAYKHTRDYFEGLDENLYTVGYSRSETGQEIDIVVQENAVDLQYIEAKYRNNSPIRDSDGIVVFGMKDTPGYVITKDPGDFGLTQRKETTLYRIPAVAYFYLIGRMS
jgi:predicted AAA+ superfamily ATPase